MTATDATTRNIERLNDAARRRGWIPFSESAARRLVEFSGLPLSDEAINTILDRTGR